jgi:hypothetical protein
VALTALLLALVSIAGIWFLLIKPAPAPPFFLTISIGEFNARQYPVLPFARQDGELLQRHFPARKQAETKTKELLRHELQGLTARSEPLIVHIAALGLVRGDKIYLVPGDADPDDDATLLEVREVIEAVGRCPARHKLLILDLAHPLADPRLGVLADRAAAALEEHLGKDPPGFFVLCPTSAGEYSLHSEVLQSSALAYYLDQGLQGAADADRDLRVTIQELFAFVEPHVERWAQLNLGLHQRPRLFGKADDFVLSSINRSTPGALDRPKLEAYPTRLQEGWKKRDHWRDRQALRRAPRLLMRLEASLQRQDELWRGGAVTRKELESQEDDLTALDRDLTRAMATQPLPPRSLAVATSQTGAVDNSALVEAVMNVVAAAKDTGGKKEAHAKLVEELVKKLQEPKEITYVQQAWAVVAALERAAQVRPEYFALVQDVLARLNPNQRFLEVLYVRRLNDFAERVQARGPDTWPTEKVQALLNAIHWREQCVAALAREPGLLPWAAPTIDAADALRQTGEKKLLWERPSNWADALITLQAAAEKYKQASETLDSLGRSRADLDRALADLPSYMEFICDWPTFDAEAEVTWNSAAQEALAVQAFFAEPATKETSLLKLDAPSRSMHRHLVELDRLLARRCADAKKGDKGDTLSKALSLLKTPLLNAPERLAVFDKQRALAAQLQEQTDKLDQEDTRMGRPAGRSTDRAQDVGVVRARMSLALLRLGKVIGKEPLPELTGSLGPREWTQLELAVHHMWSKDLVKRWNTADSLATADLLDRLVPPWEVERRTGAAREPSTLLARQQRQVFARWLEERYQAEARFLEERDPPAASFFLEAARELRLRQAE